MIFFFRLIQIHQWDGEKSRRWAGSLGGEERAPWGETLVRGWKGEGATGRWVILKRSLEKGHVKVGRRAPRNWLPGQGRLTRAWEEPRVLLRLPGSGCVCVGSRGAAPGSDSPQRQLSRPPAGFFVCRLRFVRGFIGCKGMGRGVREELGKPDGTLTVEKTV